jgi:hypothetical protein
MESNEELVVGDGKESQFDMMVGSSLSVCSCWWKMYERRV